MISVALNINVTMCSMRKITYSMLYKDTCSCKIQETADLNLTVKSFFC